LRVAVVCDDPSEDGEPRDRLAAEGSLVQVDEVAGALGRLDIPFERVPFRGDVAAFAADVERARPTLAFNLCQSLACSHVARLLELLGVNYTGAPPLAIDLTTDKALCKAVLEAHRVPTPPGRAVATAEEAELLDLPFPLIVKPRFGDNSVAIDDDAVVTSRRALAERCRWLIATYGQPAVVERYVAGRELTVALFGNLPDTEALPIREIDFRRIGASRWRMYDYELKWRAASPANADEAQVCPAKLPDVIAKRVEETAVEAARWLGCRDYARVDLRLDRAGVAWVVDVNTNPDVQAGAGFEIAWRAAGRDLDGFVSRLLALANDPGRQPMGSL
jgi:D-alanine-D-alanine ligase